MLVAATQASAAGDRRRELISGWAIKALTTTSTHNMIKTLAILAAELYLSSKAANLACNALFLTDATMAEKARKLPVDQSLFLAFRQALSRYTRERSCPAYMGPIIVNLSNLSHLLQASILPEHSQPSLHFCLQLGLLSTGYDIMEGSQQASPPAARMLKNYVCRLVGQGMLFPYLKTTVQDRADGYDPAVESFLALILSKAHLEGSSTQGISLENDVNQVYLRRDLREAQYPNKQLRQPTVFQPFIAMSKRKSPEATKRKSLLPEPDYLKKKFTS